MSKKITLVVVVLVVVVILTGISLLVPREKPEEGTQVQDRQQAPVREFTKPAVTIPSTKDSSLSIYPLTITAEGFNPHEVVLRRGDFAQFNIANATNIPVDIKADVIGLYVPSVQPNGKATVSLDASKNAEIEVVCDKFCPDGVKLLGKFIIQ